MDTDQARALTPQEVAQLLARLAPIKRDTATAMSSMATRHRLNVQAIQLAQLVTELGATELLGGHAAAIRAAIAAHSRDDAVAACAAFERAAEGTPAPEPVVVEQGEDVASIVTSPAPAPANDNDHDPERAHPVPVRAQDDPEREHAAPTVADSAAPIAGAIVTVEQLGAAVRAARARKGLSQQAVASAAGVGRRFIVELEGGKVTSEVGRVFAVCQAVGLVLIPAAA